MKSLSIFSATLLLAVLLQNATAQNIARATTDGNVALSGELLEAKRLAEALHASADKVNSEVWIGTMYNEFDLARHTCYALGMLLGLGESVRHLRFDRNPPLTAHDSDQAQDLRINAQSLYNFERATSFSLKMSPAKRRIAWNLDCAQQHGISAARFPHTGAATFYELTNEGRGIRILGAIEKGFTTKLSAILKKNPDAEFVALGSGGGSVEEALAAGRLIRSKELSTTIWNNCYSACPLVFLGGVKRHIHSPYPSLGFHQFYTSTGAVAPNAPIYAQVTKYIQEMGVDSLFVYTAILRATPAEMNMINGTDARLCQTRIATWIQRVCEAKH